MTKRALQDELIYEILAVVEEIPEGSVATYGQIARFIGRPRSARLVGWALSSCPDGSGVPCHRVVNRLGGLSDAFSPLGKESQRLLLEMEGVPFRLDGGVDLTACMWYGEEE